VRVTIPGDIEKVDELTSSPGADPVEAVAVKLSPPIDVNERLFKGLGVKAVDLLVLEVAAPRVHNDIVLRNRAHAAGA
jgi:hypothetical protein